MKISINDFFHEKMNYCISSQLYLKVKEEHILCRTLERFLIELPNNMITFNYLDHDYTLPYRFFNVIRYLILRCNYTFNDTIKKLLDQDEASYHLIYDRIRGRYYFNEPVEIGMTPILYLIDTARTGALEFKKELYYIL